MFQIILTTNTDYFPKLIVLYYNGRALRLLWAGTEAVYIQSRPTPVFSHLVTHQELIKLNYLVNKLYKKWIKTSN
jgi:hypothetical protein